MLGGGGGWVGQRPLYLKVYHILLKDIISNLKTQLKNMPMLSFSPKMRRLVQLVDDVANSFSSVTLSNLAVELPVTYGAHSVLYFKVDCSDVLHKMTKGSLVRFC